MGESRAKSAGRCCEQLFATSPVMLKAGSRANQGLEPKAVDSRIVTRPPDARVDVYTQDLEIT